MYGKVFASLFMGSMRGKPDMQLVFMNMIATCDRDGIADKVPEAIAEETGLPLDRVLASIAVLSSPDPNSRSTDCEGRRIVNVSDKRTWGWRIVNYKQYRQIGNATQRREYMREYMSEYSKPDGRPKPEGYDEAAIIYANYPRKVGKPAAISKIIAALKKVSVEFLLERTKLFASMVAKWPEDQKHFCPHPSTWYHQERYNDDPLTWDRKAINKHAGPPRNKRDAF